MTAPIDGYAIYEGINTKSGASIWQPRLQQIAAAGFKLVLNYGFLHGHLSDLTAYTNYAYSLGLKNIVYLADVRIWRDGTYGAAYPEIYADSGNASTGIAFAQYVVSQMSGLPGTWGYYVGDEVIAADHSTFAPYSAVIKTTDSSHPRLIVLGASDPTNSFGGGTTAYYDSCDVGGDDYYPVGNTQVKWLDLGIETSGIQSYCDTHSIQSAIVLQAQSWNQYYPSSRSSAFPLSSPWPNAQQMQYFHDTVLANMQPRLVLWYSFFDLTECDNPGQMWNDLQYATFGTNSIATDLTYVSFDWFLGTISSSSWPRASDRTFWLQSSGTATPSNPSGTYGQLTGTTDKNYMTMFPVAKSCAQYLANFSQTTPTSDKVGIILNYADSNNLVRVEIAGTVINIVRVSGGVETTLASGPLGFTMTANSQYWLKVIDDGLTYTIKAWNPLLGVEPSTTILSVGHSSYPVGSFGIFVQLSSTSNITKFYRFSALDPAQTDYYVSSSGSDSNIGTQSAPFATIQRANNAVLPGGTVHVAAGTYAVANATVYSWKNGTATAPVQYVSTGTQQALIRMINVVTQWINTGFYANIIGFDISSSYSLAQNGIINYGGYCNIQSNYLHGFLVTGSIGIYNPLNTTPYNNSQDNFIVNIGTGTDNQAAAIAHFSPYGLIQNNIIITSAGYGIETYNGATGLTISNNLVANCQFNNIVIGGNGTNLTNDHTIVTNNILLYCNASSGAFRELGNTGTHNQYLNNLLYGGFTNTTLQNGNVTAGTIIADPLVINYQANGTGDYHTQTASPAIDAGIATGAATTDYTGLVRALKYTMDIGPYSYPHYALFPTAIRRVGQFPTTKRRESA